MDTCPQTAGFRGLNFYLSAQYCYCFYDDGQLYVGSGIFVSNDGNLGTGPITQYDTNGYVNCYKFNAT